MTVAVIDLDGVVFNFNEAFIRKALELRIDTDVGLDFIPSVWNWPTEEADWTPKQVDYVWRSIDATPNWWTTLKPLVGHQTVKQLNEASLDNDVYYLTNRKSSAGDVERQSILALETLGIRNPRVLCVKNKAAVAKALGAQVAIDDRVENLIQFSQYDIFAVCRRWPYNTEWTGAAVPDLHAFLTEYPL